MSKKKMNGLSGVSKFVDSFFEGVKNNTADRMIEQARKERIEREALEKKEQHKRDEEDLKNILGKYADM